MRSLHRFCLLLFLLGLLLSLAWTPAAG